MRLNIEAERARLCMSKESISEALDISSKTYNNYINDRPIPSDILQKMLKLFGCSVDYLLEQNLPARRQDRR